MSEAITPEIYEMIEGYVRFFAMGMMRDALRYREIEDLTHDVVIKFMRHKHIEKFNKATTSMKYHVMNGVKTTIIDILRKEKYSRQELALDRPIGNDEEGEAMTLLDTISAHTTEPHDVLYLAEMLATLKEDSKEWGKEVDLPFLGKAKVSAYSVYLLFIIGFKKSEIAKLFGFTPARAGDIVAEAEQKMIQLGFKIPSLQL